MGAAESLQNYEPCVDARNSCDDFLLVHSDFLAWCDELHDEYHFPFPCTEFHDNGVTPYSYRKCNSLEIKVGRRRSVQFRRDLSLYTAELVKDSNNYHYIHLRNLKNNTVYIIELSKATNNLPELYIMYRPILTVIGYQQNKLAVSIQEKTKNIPKLLVFLDVDLNTQIGHYVINLDYNHLSSVEIDCCFSNDGSKVVVYVSEDHYDEFSCHFHALNFNDCTAEVICEEKLEHSSWCEACLYISFLPDSKNNYVILFGEYPVGYSYSGITKHLSKYDLKQKKIIQDVVLDDNSYPVLLACSPDGTWIATMSRDSVISDICSQNYIVRLYSSYDMQHQMTITLPISSEAFDVISHCNKLVFSKKSCLICVASTVEQDDNSQTHSFLGGPHSEVMNSLEMFIYRLPSCSMRLKSLCRDLILSNCKMREIRLLYLPECLQDYLMYR